MLNKTYQITKLNSDGTEKSLFKVWTYKVDGETIRTVRIINGKKSAKAENYTVSDFNHGLRLGSVKEVA